MKPVVLHAEAKAELSDAAAWYEDRKAGLGTEFREAVENTIARIQRDPEIGERYGTTRFRFCLVRRFPYVIFYGVRDESIRVVAISHAKRRPGYWRHRAAD